MSEMIERVARAIEEKMFDEHDRPVDPALHRIYFEVARAAIEAMREPTARMSMAGSETAEWARAASLSVDAEAVWQAMIDAALTQSPQDTRPATSGDAAK